MGNIVETVGDRIQNAILTSNDSNITPKIEWAVKSINTSPDKMRPVSRRIQDVGNP